MFGIGMHFSVRDLLPVRAIALPGAVAQIAVATSLGIMLAMLAVIVIGKSLAAFGIMRALTVAAWLAQIGEFSFILAELGISLGLLPPEGQHLILAGALLSITLNPMAFRMVSRWQSVPAAWRLWPR